MRKPPIPAKRSMKVNLGFATGGNGTSEKSIFNGDIFLFSGARPSAEPPCASKFQLCRIFLHFLPCDCCRRIGDADGECSQWDNIAAISSRTRSLCFSALSTAISKRKASSCGIVFLPEAGEERLFSCPHVNPFFLCFSFMAIK